MSNVGHTSLERGARDAVVFVRAVHELWNVRVVRKIEYINDLLHIFEGLPGWIKHAWEEDGLTGTCQERPDLDQRAKRVHNLVHNALEIFLKIQVPTRYTRQSKIEALILRDPCQRMTWRVTLTPPAGIPSMDTYTCALLRWTAPVPSLSSDRSVSFVLELARPLTPLGYLQN